MHGRAAGLAVHGAAAPAALVDHRIIPRSPVRQEYATMTALPADPPWPDHPGWLRLVVRGRYAPGGQAPVVLRWALAAGGSLAGADDDGTPRVLLPELPPGPAFSALKQCAATLGVHLVILPPHPTPTHTPAATDAPR
jgi:hypothetical protein